MKKHTLNTHTPTGVRDYTPEEATAYDTTITTLTTIFKQAGYHHIKTPIMEHDDAIHNALSPTLKNHTIRFFGNNGKTMILRPDHTAVVARMVAQRMSTTPRPIKVFYEGSVFRQQPNIGEQETPQVGIEYIGDAGPAVDTHIIKLCLSALEATGLSQIYVDIGHPTFTKTLSKNDIEALTKGDYVTLGHTPKMISLDDCPHNTLKPLTKLLTKLPQAPRIRLNPSLIKDFTYYTGIVFECYVEGIGKPIATGGRYDTLLSHFGNNEPAIGFAIHIDRLNPT